MGKVCVIIPAAGKGERFGGAEKKAFAKLDGRPLFLRTLEHFIRREDVCQTILAVAPEDLSGTKAMYGPNLAFMGVQVVEGGAQRWQTVSAALKAIKEGTEYIAIHDAARPCVSDEQINAVFTEAMKTGAAILAVPLTGTIKHVAASMVVEKTISRERLYEAQTPQVFRRDILLGAYARLGSTPEEATDDAQVVERSGHPVSIVLSDSTNLKVTTRGDLTLAAAILKARPARTGPRLGAFEEAQW
ncbi:MAG: 2-C-methyl-D-erythritol 4-phosphate cytidylyltransferase [Planctomycetes bacterium]|nr:2-C-methyl-D-erythritol 4-phosphate cytidylyltransferase [Planctomycetota bacterium]